MAQPGAMLSVEDLAIAIDGHRIVDGVSLSVASRRILAIVGESGCGKSVTALSMLGLLPKAAQVAGGTIRLGERTLTALSEAEMAQVRGNDAAIMFQEPVASLNPLMRVGAQVEEALLLHRGLSRSAAREEAIATMARVGIPDPARRAQQYPFELSGGMCQRIMIASALICRPSLLIADERQGAALCDVEGNAVDGLHHAARRADAAAQREMHLEIPDLQQRFDRSVSARAAPVHTIIAHAMASTRSICQQAASWCGPTGKDGGIWAQVSSASGQRVRKRQPPGQEPTGGTMPSMVRRAVLRTPSSFGIVASKRRV